MVRPSSLSLVLPFSLNSNEKLGEYSSFFLVKEGKRDINKKTHINEWLMAFYFFMVALQQVSLTLEIVGFSLSLVGGFSGPQYYKMSMVGGVFTALVELMLCYLFWVFGKEVSVMKVSSTGQMTMVTASIDSSINELLNASKSSFSPLGGSATNLDESFTTKIMAM